MRKSRTFIYTVVVILVLCLISTLFLGDNLASRITTVVTVVTAIIGAVALFIQFKKDKDVNQANFIIEFGKYFNEMSGTEKVLECLERYRKGDKKALTMDIYSGIVNYLTWCESLSVLIQREVMDLDIIDNLYSYNFFLITNNKWIQDNELIPSAEYYKGVYGLHKYWSDYKRKTGQSIMEEETSLSKVERYEEFAQKGNLFDKKHH